MKPRISHVQDPQASLFGMALKIIVNPPPPLAILAGKINWERFEQELAPNFSEATGAPAKPTRLMVGPHCLKHACNLSDGKTVAYGRRIPTGSISAA